MAIHPYPAELEGELKLRDGSTLLLRPIRPEDAALEKRFFEGLSEKSRYQRFLNQMAQLPPSLLARFTQLDYDRELALVALAPGARRALLERLCDCARSAGYRTLFGNILNANQDMLGLAERLGFVQSGRDGDLMTVARALR